MTGGATNGDQDRPRAPGPQPRPGPKSATTVGEWLRGLALAHGEREAVVGSGGRLTYRRLDDRSALLARGLLSLGVGKGTRVGLWLGNGPEWVLCFAAVARCGGVAVPLSTFFSDAELATVVRHADLAGLFVHPRFLGEDQRTRLARALPGLEGLGPPPFALQAAPYLRWVCTTEGILGGGVADRPVEAAFGVGPDWLEAAAERPGFGPSLLAAAESEVFPDDEAIQIYTSGSTAMAKGVPHTHRTILDKTHYLREWLGIGDGVRSFIASPFFWVGGLTMSLFPVLDGGGTQFCTDRFEAESVMQLIDDERVERAVLYPHHVNLLLAHPDFERWARPALVDADPRLLRPEVRPVPDPEALRIGLGMTETFGGYWWGRPRPVDPATIRPGERRPPPLEVVQPGVELKVADAHGHPVGDGERGEVCIRGATIMSGLYKVDRERSFDVDGWFHTGDEGEVDGWRVHFRGRLSDMIKTAGANVAPGEVVAALRELDGVQEAYVLGLPDPVRGQVVAAAVVPEADRVLDPEEMRRELRARLSVFKVPAHIVFFSEEEIPWTASHKVRVGQLAERVAERAAVESMAKGS